MTIFVIVLWILLFISPGLLIAWFFAHPEHCTRCMKGVILWGCSRITRGRHAWKNPKVTVTKEEKVKES